MPNGRNPLTILTGIMTIFMTREIIKPGRNILSGPPNRFRCEYYRSTVILPLLSSFYSMAMPRNTPACSRDLYATYNASAFDRRRKVASRSMEWTPI